MYKYIYIYIYTYVCVRARVCVSMSAYVCIYACLIYVWDIIIHTSMNIFNFKRKYQSTIEEYT